MTILVWLLLILPLSLAPELCARGSDQILLYDIEGQELGDLFNSEHTAHILFFVTHDCPISNQLAPEIQRICTSYEGERFQCYLIYVDPDLTVEEVREHVADYGHKSPAILDTNHRLVELAGATITPEVAVFSKSGRLLYRGRINNFYERLGRPRRNVTSHDLRVALDQIGQKLPVEPGRTQAIGCFIPTRQSLDPQ